MNRISYIFGFAIYLWMAFSGEFVFAQKTRSQLENEKKQAVQKLQDAQKILGQTEKKKESSIGQLKALNYQIKVRETVIKTISGEIILMNEEISEFEMVISFLEDDLNNLKKEYSSMVYTTYKANAGFRNLTYIFSANTFNQLVMRIKYMEQYADERTRQLLLIKEVRESLVAQMVNLEKTKSEKDNLLNQEVAQNKNLISLRKKQNRILTELTKQETEIKKELDDRKTAVTRLDRLIANLVAKEIKESSKGKSSDRITLSGDLATLSKAFESNYSKMNWPVNSGFISEKFGTHPHPVFKRVMVSNLGIDIQTGENEQIKAVYSGEVKSIAIVPGEMKYIVIVQHGEYFTVYAKLKSVNVKMGQVIRENDIIGVVNTDQDGISELQFQIWKNNKKLNPESWLARK